VSVVIDYETFSKIHDLHNRQGLTIAQTARALRLDRKTVSTWAARSRFEPRRSRPRRSVLDPFKPRITRMLDSDPCSAQKIFQRLRKEGYRGGVTILRDYVRSIRPTKPPAYKKPTDHRSVRADLETSQHEQPHRRASRTYTLRIEHIMHPTPQISVASASGKPSYLASANPSITEMNIRPNWSREFTVLERYTLEQLSEIILHILGWERDHLFEFRFADRVCAHLVYLEEDELFVDAENQCTSCDIPLRHLGISAGDVFAYIFDFGNYHSFRVTVRDIRPTRIGEIVPALLCFQGKNILQYPGSMRQSGARLFRNRPPAVIPPQPARDRHRIRFIRAKDGSVLREWRASNNKKQWQKAVAILESRNLSPKNIAAKIERSENDVEKWIKAFNRFGLEGLKKPDGSRGPAKSRERDRRAAVRDQKIRRILEIVHAKPSAYGINRSSWHRPSIVRAYEQEHKETISVGYAGHLLRQSGYAIRKARKVLTSPDPRYREKVDLLLSTLQNLKPGELFFFVDELGPLRVKKYGGRAFVRKNEVLTYPQEQAPRGVIMMSGALSATTNQMTWVYGRAKDTAAMIDLIELLYNQYFSSPKLYVTWDTASWHKSAMLVEWLDVFNSTTRVTGEGPLIELVPLPTSSQFLDVIEAVFSGMKRAVVHHSNYSDASEMKKAISLHFAERNAHFRENPRRAGKQVWKIDFFDDNENIRSGNYREW
jgi:transposase